MFGVRIWPQPYAPVAQAPWSSVMNITTLGRADEVRDCVWTAGAASARPRRLLRVISKPIVPALQSEW
jgi:hypothetical protein